ncbi:uncharacterized protein G2W53_003499 [Senna tora]|uniref:Uncharacterized protein n=1 Tax=Senna tora TaxID=362788 RepID=A0A835CGZ1_9FABA|nr:uncharacterized protein G2W53_003499 [Senna tora]
MTVTDEERKGSHLLCEPDVTIKKKSEGRETKE